MKPVTRIEDESYENCGDCSHYYESMGCMPLVANPKATRPCETIEKAFRYHAPKDGQAELYIQIRTKAKEYAYLIDKLVPDSREKSLAMTKLEEAVMWANAGIARNG